MSIEEDMKKFNEEFREELIAAEKRIISKIKKLGDEMIKDEKRQEGIRNALRIENAKKKYKEKRRKKS